MFIGRNDGLLALSPDSKKVELLVSSRRTPAVNEIDPLWTGSTRIFPQADGRLGALNDDHGFIFDPNTSAWKLRALPLTGTNRYFSMTAAYTAPGGAEWLLTGPLDHRYLVGFGNDDGPAESLLMEETGIGVKSPPQEKLLQPVRWDWPQKYPMEHGCIVGDGKKLWVLSPRKTWLGMFGQEPVTYSDNRQATLFGFEPEFRTPLSVAIHFEEIELPKINGMPTDMLAPMTGGGMDIWERLRNHNGNWAFWLPTPEGLVFGAPNYSGHWLIPSAAVESRLQPQREALRKK